MQVEQPDNQEFDKKFEDDAWIQMNVLLDKEMPVQKERKRRIFFLLFLFFALLVGGAVGYYSYHSSSKSKDIPNIPIAAKNIKSKVEQSDISNAPNKSTQNNITANLKSDSILIGSENIISNTKKSSENLKKRSNSSSPVTNKEQVSLLSSKNNQRTILNDSNTDNSEPETQNSEPATPNKQLETINSQLETLNQDFATLNPQPTIRNQIKQEVALLPLHPVNTISIKPISSVNSSFSTPPFLQTDPHRISRWELGIQAGAIATLQGGIIPALGINTAYLLSPKWKLQLSADWLFSEESTTISFNEDADFANELIDMDASGSRFMMDQDSNLKIDSILGVASKQYHFLSIPLSITYRLNKRFGLYGGIQYLAVLGNPSMLRREEDLSATSTNNTGLNLDDQSLKVRSSWQWHTGLNFQMNPRWAIDFSYHNILPKQNGRNHLDQYFQLSAKYRIR